MSENREHDWVERARCGEPAAIAELYRRYWRAARAAAYGVTGDTSLAEDAASEAFCAALRMQFGDNPIPAAIGGVLNHWSILPEGVYVGSITVYLEPWAAAHGGQIIELTEGTPFPSLGHQSREPA